MGGGMVADLSLQQCGLMRTQKIHPVLGISVPECRCLWCDLVFFLAIWRKKVHPDRSPPAVTVNCSQPIRGIVSCLGRGRKEDCLLCQGRRANFTIEWANEVWSSPVEYNPFEVSR